MAMRTDLFKAVNQLNNNAESKALMNAFQIVNNAREMRLAFVLTIQARSHWVFFNT